MTADILILDDFRARSGRGAAMPAVSDASVMGAGETGRPAGDPADRPGGVAAASRDMASGIARMRLAAQLLLAARDDLRDLVREAAADQEEDATDTEGHPREH